MAILAIHVKNFPITRSVFSLITFLQESKSEARASCLNIWVSAFNIINWLFSNYSPQMGMSHPCFRQNTFPYPCQNRLAIYARVLYLGSLYPIPFVCVIFFFFFFTLTACGLRFHYLVTISAHILPQIPLGHKSILFIPRFLPMSQLFA